MSLITEYNIQSKVYNIDSRCTIGIKTNKNAVVKLSGSLTERNWQPLQDVNLTATKWASTDIVIPKMLKNTISKGYSDNYNIKFDYYVSNQLAKSEIKTITVKNNDSTLYIQDMYIDSAKSNSINNTYYASIGSLSIYTNIISSAGTKSITYQLDGPERRSHTIENPNNIHWYDLGILNLPGNYTLTAVVKDKSGAASTKNINFKVQSYGSWFEVNELYVRNAVIKANSYSEIYTSWISTVGKVTQISYELNDAEIKKVDIDPENYNNYISTSLKFNDIGTHKLSVVLKNDKGTTTKRAIYIQVVGVENASKIELLPELKKDDCALQSGCFVSNKSYITFDLNIKIMNTIKSLTIKVNDKVFNVKTDNYVDYITWSYGQITSPGVKTIEFKITDINDYTYTRHYSCFALENWIESVPKPQISYMTSGEKLFLSEGHKIQFKGTSTNINDYQIIYSVESCDVITATYSCDGYRNSYMEYNKALLKSALLDNLSGSMSTYVLKDFDEDSHLFQSKNKSSTFVMELKDPKANADFANFYALQWLDKAEGGDLIRFYVKERKKYGSTYVYSSDLSADEMPATEMFEMCVIPPIPPALDINIKKIDGHAITIEYKNPVYNMSFGAISPTPVIDVCLIVTDANGKVVNKSRNKRRDAENGKSWVFYNDRRWHNLIPRDYVDNLGKAVNNNAKKEKYTMAFDISNYPAGSNISIIAFYYPDYYNHPSIYSTSDIVSNKEFNVNSKVKIITPKDKAILETRNPNFEIAVTGNSRSLFERFDLSKKVSDSIYKIEKGDKEVAYPGNRDTITFTFKPKLFLLFGHCYASSCTYFVIGHEQNNGSYLQEGYYMDELRCRARVYSPNIQIKQHQGKWQLTYNVQSSWSDRSGHVWWMALGEDATQTSWARYKVGELNVTKRGEIRIDDLDFKAQTVFLVNKSGNWYTIPHYMDNYRKNVYHIHKFANGSTSDYFTENVPITNNGGYVSDNGFFINRPEHYQGAYLEPGIYKYYAIGIATENSNSYSIAGELPIFRPQRLKDTDLPNFKKADCYTSNHGFVNVENYPNHKINFYYKFASLFENESLYNLDIVSNSMKAMNYRMDELFLKINNNEPIDLGMIPITDLISDGEVIVDYKSHLDNFLKIGKNTIKAYTNAYKLIEIPNSEQSVPTFSHGNQKGSWVSFNEFKSDVLMRSMPWTNNEVVCKPSSANWASSQNDVITIKIPYKILKNSASYTLSLKVKATPGFLWENKTYNISQSNKNNICKSFVNITPSGTGITAGQVSTPIYSPQARYYYSYTYWVSGYWYTEYYWERVGYLSNRWPCSGCSFNDIIDVPHYHGTYEYRWERRSREVWEPGYYTTRTSSETYSNYNNQYDKWIDMSLNFNTKNLDLLNVQNGYCEFKVSTQGIKMLNIKDLKLQSGSTTYDNITIIEEKKFKYVLDTSREIKSDTITVMYASLSLDNCPYINPLIVSQVTDLRNRLTVIAESYEIEVTPAWRTLVGNVDHLQARDFNDVKKYAYDLFKGLKSKYPNTFAGDPEVINKIPNVKVGITKRGPRDYSSRGGHIFYEWDDLVDAIRAQFRFIREVSADSVESATWSTKDNAWIRKNQTTILRSTDLEPEGISTPQSPAPAPSQKYLLKDKKLVTNNEFNGLYLNDNRGWTYHDATYGFIFGTSGSSAYYSQATTNNKVNLNNYTRLTVKFDVSFMVDGFSQYTICAYSTANKNIGTASSVLNPVKTTVAKSLQSGLSGNTVTIDLDISSLTGEYYLGICVKLRQSPTARAVYATDIYIS